jgi:branched-chain amino acid aminotransferase
MTLTQNAIVNVNGQIISPTEAKVSVFDRSFLYGDSLYEVVRTYQGKFFGVDEHLKRLENSASLCHMSLAQRPDLFKKEISRTFDAFRAQKGCQNTEAYCRIVVSRGTGRIGFGLDSLITPTQYVLITQPLDVPSAEKFEAGCKLRVVDRLRNHPRALDPAMKSGNYLNSLLAYLEAREQGFDDALLANGDDHIAEGSTFNIGYVKNGILVTPPLDIGILDGITRRHILQMAQELGIETREVRFPRERLYEADEVLWMSSLREAFPVTQVDDRKIGNGKPGPITRKLSSFFKEFAIKTLSTTPATGSASLRLVQTREL